MHDPRLKVSRTLLLCTLVCELPMLPNVRGSEGGWENPGGEEAGPGAGVTESPLRLRA